VATGALDKLKKINKTSHGKHLAQILVHVAQINMAAFGLCGLKQTKEQAQTT
jgi:hypothetical protein